MPGKRRLTTCKACGIEIQAKEERIRVTWDKVSLIGSKTLASYHYKCFKELIKNAKQKL